MKIEDACEWCAGTARIAMFGYTEDQRVSVNHRFVARICLECWRASAHVGMSRSFLCGAQRGRRIICIAIRDGARICELRRYGV